MANKKLPTREQLPILEELRRVAVLRRESDRYYRRLFTRALATHIPLSVIARHANRCYTRFVHRSGSHQIHVERAFEHG